MKAKYCIVPDTAKFFEFLAGLSFSESDILHTRLIRPQKIFVDVEQSEWVIEYKAAAPVEERLVLAVADKLAAAFSLHKVELSCCNAEVNVKAETEEIPLPPEPPDVPSSETVPSREMSISSRSAISSSPPLSEAVLSTSLPLPQPTADKHRNTASISDNNLIIFLFIIILLTFISLKDWIVTGTT